MSEIRFFVPIAPLSQNHVYRLARFGGMFMTAEGKAYKNLVGLSAQSGVTMGMLNGHLGIEAKFYVASFRGDGDNYFKIFIDALQGIVYKNDRQLKHYVFDVVIDKKNPRIECRVWELPTSDE